jgi:hypothetical protein
MDEMFPVMWWSLVAFAITFVVLHIFVFVWLRRSDDDTREKYKKEWIATDYLWALGATTALVIACVSVRRDLAPRYLEFAKGRYDASKQMAKDRAQFGATFYTDYNFSQWPAGREELIAEYNRVAKWYRDGLEAITANEDEKWQSFLRDRANEVSVDRGLKQSQDQFVDALKYADESKQAVDRVQSKTERSGWEWALYIVSPIVIGVALGARVAKTTAQIKGLC